MKNIIKIAGIAFLGTATVMGYLRYQAFKAIAAAEQEKKVIEIAEVSTDEDSRK